MPFVTEMILRSLANPLFSQYQWMYAAYSHWSSVRLHAFIALVWLTVMALLLYHNWIHYILQIAYRTVCLFFVHLYTVSKSLLMVSLLLRAVATDINLNSPNKGLGTNDLSDVPVEGAVGNAIRPLPPGLTEEEAEELRTELTKVCRDYLPCHGHVHICSI